MKKQLKQVVQSAVAVSAPALWRFRGASLVVMMYHRVLPATHPARDSEQPGMFVSPESLQMQVSTLKEDFTLVHLDDWLERAQSGAPVPSRACAITFDDGWRDNYQFAFPILKASQAPATVYLVSDLVGTRYSFWPNTLAGLLAGDDSKTLAKLPSWLRELVSHIGENRSGIAGIDAIITSCKDKYSDKEMLAALADVANESAGERDLMDWDEIRESAGDGLIRFGSHTRRHTRLSKIKSGEELRDEIVTSAEAIHSQLGTAPKTFCYPNGDVSPPALELVRSTYLGAVTTTRGWNKLDADKHLLQRVGVHEDVSHTRPSFVSRLAGVG